MGLACFDANIFLQPTPRRGGALSDAGIASQLGSRPFLFFFFEDNVTLLLPMFH